MNKLFYGDNLTILSEQIDSESVDLIYLDPPFNSNRNYNVLFKDESGNESAAQITAFEDTWHWNTGATAESFEDLVLAGDAVSEMIQAMRTFIGANQMMAYLVMMAVRLKELHRVLKPTGSLYLHCDPTASHYLKLLLDAVFGPKRFLNEAIWKRSSAHSDTKQGMKRMGKIHDVILVYTKSEEWVWNTIYTSYDSSYLENEYRHVAPDGRRYKQTDVTAAKSGGDTEYIWRVKRRPGESWQADLSDEYLTPKSGFEYQGVLPYRGRFWAYSKANMIEFARKGKLIHRATGVPRLAQFADEMPGVALQDLWDDIPPASGSQALGYPTQKPVALLERIIAASSNENDVVLDPFCGCGTTIAAAETLGRKWIGIDVTHLSIALQKYRLKAAFGLVEKQDYEVIGEPKDLAGARMLASESRYQFQWWALSLVKARPLGGTAGSREGKKGSDKGVDGVIPFFDEQRERSKRVLIQVKSGKVKSGDIRDLKGTVEREKAAIGVFITLEPPTRDMQTEAATGGFYESPHLGRFPRIQILTVEEILAGKSIAMPTPFSTFREASKADLTSRDQITLGFVDASMDE